MLLGALGYQLGKLAAQPLAVRVDLPTVDRPRPSEGRSGITVSAGARDARPVLSGDLGYSRAQAWVSALLALAMTRSGLSFSPGQTSKLTTGIVVGVLRLKYPP